MLLQLEVFWKQTQTKQKEWMLNHASVCLCFFVNFHPVPQPCTEAGGAVAAPFCCSAPPPGVALIGSKCHSRAERNKQSNKAQDTAPVILFFFLQLGGGIWKQAQAKQEIVKVKSCLCFLCLLCFCVIFALCPSLAQKHLHSLARPQQQQLSLLFVWDEGGRSDTQGNHLQVKGTYMFACWLLAPLCWSKHIHMFLLTAGFLFCPPLAWQATISGSRGNHFCCCSPVAYVGKKGNCKS